MLANDRMVGGDHYRRGGAKFQHWDFAVRILQNRYLEGNITKYVARHRFKNQARDDLEKAGHYLDKLLEEFDHGRVKPPVHSVPTEGIHYRPIHDFCCEHDLNSLEEQVMRGCANWTCRAHLIPVKDAIEQLLAIVKGQE